MRRRFVSCAVLGTCALFTDAMLMRISSAAVVDATWNINGNDNWNTAANWDIGVVPDNNATDQYNVRIDNNTNANSTVSLNITPTINNLIVDAGDSLAILNSFTLNIAGSSVVDNGAISLGSTGNLTDLVIQNAATTLSGTGTLSLGANGNNRIYSNDGTNELINGAAHTIAGTGQLGVSLLKLTNQGTIDANLAAGLLTIDPNATGVTNTGTLRASGGATLRLQDGTFTNTGGTISALAASTVELSAGTTIVGGTLSSVGNGLLTINGNTVTLQDVTMNLATPLQIDNAVSPVLKGTITVNGNIAQNSTGNITDVLIDGDLTIGGTGVWTMSNSANNRIFSIAGTNVLTVPATRTIQGAGQIGASLMGLNNQGLIDANQSTLLTIDPNATGVTNTGTLRASGGATLRLQDGTFTNTGGTISALAASTVELSAGTTIVGGTLSSVGNGLLTINGNTVTLQDVTMNLATPLQIDNAVSPVLKGTITVNGNIAQNSTGNITDVLIDGDLTIGGTGVWTMSNSANNRIFSIAGTNVLTVPATRTIQGAGQIGASLMGLNNQGLIDANQSTLLTIDPNATGVTNTGTLRASGGATLRLQDGTFTNTGGTISALAASTVELSAGTTIVGGTLSSVGNGLLTINGNTVTLQDVTISTGSLMQINNAVSPVLKGTIANNGVIEQNSTGNITDVPIDGDVTLAGSGVWRMSNAIPNRIYSPTGTGVLTNGAQHTIQGAGQIGVTIMGLTNQGLIDANQSATLTIDPADTLTVVNESTGTLRGSGSGGLQLTSGTFNNLGIVEALNGSNVTYSISATASNNAAGVLTGGKWRAVATGGGATVTLQGSNITQIAAGTEVVLSGAGSVLQVATTQLESSLTTNNGTLRILNNRNYSAVPAGAMVNGGTLQLGGGMLSSAILTNNAAAEIFGYGTIAPRPTNSGTIRAAGGTLTMSAGIQGGSGTVQIDSGATLDVSGGSLDSSADLLVHNGAGLNLGSRNFLVGVDYTNAGFGVGNAFNARANVSGAGQINASPAVSQTLGGDVTGGATATATMSFGNLHVGSFSTLNYQINNLGASGPKLRGAIQTSASGANLTDTRLSGAGITASNFSPINAGANSGNLSVTFNATSTGALAGQQVRVVNNFDNVADQTLQFTGAVYRLANPTTHAPEPVNFGIVHVGDVLQQALSISNSAANDGFSERLSASIGSPTDSATTNSGSFAALLPGATNNTSLVVGINTATAGAKSGTATIALTSDGTGTSGLGNTTLANQVVNIAAQVNNFAAANVVKLSGDGTFSMTGTNQFSLSLGSIAEGQTALLAQLGVANSATAPADDLAGSFTPAAPGFSLTGFSPFANLSAGNTLSGLSVQLNSTTAGAFAGQIALQPQSTNARPFSMNLALITIQISGEVRLAGDYNHNNIVDSADYVLWRKTLGTTVTAFSAADGDGSSMIDSGDYSVWRSNFGRLVSGSAASLNSDAVPEPNCAMLIGIGAILLIGIRRRGTRPRRMLDHSKRATA